LFSVGALAAEQPDEAERASGAVPPHEID